MGLEQSCMQSCHIPSIGLNGRCDLSDCASPDRRRIQVSNSVSSFSHIDPFEPLDEQFGTISMAASGCCKPQGGTNIELVYRSVDEAIKLGRKHNAEGNRNAAWKAYMSAIDMDPQNASLRDEVGCFLLEHNQVDHALHMFEQASSADPYNWKHWYRQGVVLQQLGRPKDAVSRLEQALVYNKDSIDAQFNLGVGYQQLKDLPKASAAFVKILGKDPNNKDVLSLLSEVRAQQGDLSESMSLLQKALDLDPTNRQLKKAMDRVQSTMVKISGSSQVEGEWCNAN